NSHAYTPAQHSFPTRRSSDLCDYFTDNWEIRNGACQAISSEGNETALISDEGMVFMSMDKGCPDNLDFPGTRFITTRINDQTWRSEEHTSELQSRFDLVCRLL